MYFECEFRRFEYFVFVFEIGIGFITLYCHQRGSFWLGVSFGIMFAGRRVRIMLMDRFIFINRQLLVRILHDVCWQKVFLFFLIIVNRQTTVGKQ